MEGTRTPAQHVDPVRLVGQLLDQAIARHEEARSTDRLYAEILPDSSTPDPSALARASAQASRAFDLAERNLAEQLRGYRKAALGTSRDAWPFSVEYGGLIYVVPCRSREAGTGYRVVIVDPAETVRGGNPALIEAVAG